MWIGYETARVGTDGLNVLPLRFSMPARIRTCFAAILLLLVPPLSAASSHAPGTSTEGIPILVYHRFDPSKPGSTTVRTSVFKAQLEWLDSHHIRVVKLDAVVDALRGVGPAVKTPAVVLSVDDGNRSVYTEMFPIIHKYRLHVTLFIYPSAISNASYALTWKQLREMQASGLVEVQSHTYWHPNFRQEKARRTPAGYRDFVDYQLVHSRRTLESRLGAKVDLLAWPYGIFDPQLEHAAARTGYVAAFAYAGGASHPGVDMFAIPRIPVSDQDSGTRFGALLGKQNVAAKETP